MSFTLPKRRKRPKMNTQPPTRCLCPSQAKYVRGFDCALIGLRGTGPLGSDVGLHECEGRMESHHDTTRGAGGGDETQVPLCAKAHRNIHDGVTFPRNLAALAAAIWKQSPHRIKFERQWKEQWPNVPLPYA